MDVGGEGADAGIDHVRAHVVGSEETATVVETVGEFAVEVVEVVSGTEFVVPVVGEFAY